MAEPLLTVFGTAVVAGAGQKVGEYAGDKFIKGCEEAAEAVGQEWESAWERDKVAGGISSWGDDCETATA